METLASHLREILDPNQPEPDIKYSSVPRSKAVILADKQLEMAHDWLISLERPDNISDHEYNLVL